MPKSRPFQFWNTAPNIDEIINIMDHIPFAALIYDAEKNQIVNSNIKLLRLTTYTRLELTKLPLKDIFSISCEEKELFSELNNHHTLEINLIARNQQSIPSLLKVTPLDEKRRWFLMSIEIRSQKILQEITAQRYSILDSAIQKMAAENLSMNKGAVIEVFLHSCKELTYNSDLSLYELQKEADGPMRVKKVESSLNANIFPKMITIKDIHPYEKIIFWQKGKRSTAEFHLLTRKHQITSLISLPIKNSHTLYGILFIASPELNMDENLFSSLSSLADLLSMHYPLWETLNNVCNECEEQKSKTLLQEKIFENVQDGIILISSDLTILSLNPAAEHILGYLTYETQKQPIENILIGTGNLHSALQLALEGVETPNLGNIILHRRDGQPFNAFLQVIPVIENKKNLGIIVLIRDLSKHHEIKLRTQQLEQRALLGELTAIFAHEIRNPINNMSLAIQTMDMEFDRDDPNHIHVERLKQNLDRLTHLMDTVLSFSRSSAYNMVEMDLIPLIEKVLLRWQTHMSREKVQAHFQKEIPSAYINGDAQVLEQVFNNLISNAIRAMQDMPNGTLHIKVERLLLDNYQDTIQISVSDTGPGIPKEHLEHIFQPFFTTDHQNGTGLGLAITQRIVIAHKGKIQVKSFPSGGSVFIIHLPAIHHSEL